MDALTSKFHRWEEHAEDTADAIMAEALKELSPADEMELKKTKTYRCSAKKRLGAS